jgi:hypothetical protein
MPNRAERNLKAIISICIIVFTASIVALARFC